MEKEITHREALRLIGDAELAGLKTLSDRTGLLHLAGHIGLLAVTAIAVLTLPGPWWIAAMAAHGVALVFLFTPLHESIHGTAFRTPWINEAVASAAGFLIALPPCEFRYFHLAHHRHTQDPENDPELAGPKPGNVPQYLLYLSGLLYWKAQATNIVANALGRKIGSYVPSAGRRKVIREARIHLAAYGLIAVLGVAFRLDVLLWLWVFPAILGQPFLRAYLLAEHSACPFVADMLANTRTTFTNAAVRFLAWNMPHHTAHHALPSVPFHRLPVLTRLLRDRLKSTAASYREAHQQIRGAWKV